MAYTPPLFKNFGKSYSDLTTKNFDNDRQAKVKTTTQNGVSFETTIRTPKKIDNYSGTIRAIFPRLSFGTFEAELCTDYSGKFSLENDQWKKGFIGKASVEQTTANPALKTEASYRREYAAVSAEHKYQNQHQLKFSGALGYEGLAVGGEGTFKVDTGKVDSYDIGAEYSKLAHTFGVKTKDTIRSVTASYFHNLNADVNVGAHVESLIGTQNWKVGAALSETFDRDTTVKLKVASDRTAGFALEQRLANPKMKIGFSSEYNFDRAPVPDNFGLSFGFNEF